MKYKITSLFKIKLLLHISYYKTANVEKPTICIIKIKILNNFNRFLFLLLYCLLKNKSLCDE